MKVCSITSDTTLQIWKTNNKWLKNKDLSPILISIHSSNNNQGKNNLYNYKWKTTKKLNNYDVEHKSIMYQNDP